MDFLAPSRDWRFRLLTFGFIREGLILCPLDTIPLTLDESMNRNERIQARCAQSQPWLTLCFHFHFKVLIYIYQALTMLAHWCWFTGTSFIYSFIHLPAFIKHLISQWARGWGHE